MTAWILVGGESYNLDHVREIFWKFVTPDSPEDCRVVSSAILYLAGRDARPLEIKDPDQAHALWLWFCNNELGKSGRVNQGPAARENPR